jgi:hypothetical protein
MSGQRSMASGRSSCEQAGGATRTERTVAKTRSGREFSPDTARRRTRNPRRPALSPYAFPDRPFLAYG